MLICKPAPGKHILGQLSFSEEQTLLLRSLGHESDHRILQRWATSNRADNGYSSEDNGDDHTNPDTHGFVVILGDVLVARMICHRLQTHELGKHTATREDDIIIDLIIAPSLRPVTRLIQNIWELTLAYIYTFEKADRVYTSFSIDDQENGQPVRKTGFRFMENKVLANGAISLYLLTKRQYNEFKR